MRAAEVVVIGGGIVGLSTALCLGRGGTGVVVLERHTVGAGASGRAVGGIRQQLPDAARLALSRRGLQLHRTLIAEFDLPVRLVEIGSLLLYTTPQGAAAAQQHLELQRAQGVEVCALSMTEVLELMPALDLVDVHLATYSPRDVWADPRRVLEAYAQACRRLGVQILEHTEVTGIQASDDRVTGVLTSHGVMHAHAVVNAAGAEAARLARMVGVSLPLSPRRRQVFVFAGDAVRPGQPIVMEEEIDFYFCGHAAGVLAVRGNSPDETFDTTVDWEGGAPVRDALAHRVPALRGRVVVAAWAGIRALTPDGAPIIGPMGPDGFFVAAGFGGQGFAQGPAAGDLLASLVRTGETDVDLCPFSAERFAGGGQG